MTTTFYYIDTTDTTDDIVCPDYPDGPDKNTMWYLGRDVCELVGPIVIDANYRKEYWQNGTLHREDGPAVEWKTGRKEWYQHSQRHRENGPAIEWEDGGKSYYFCDVLYSREDYYKLLKIDST